MAGSSPAMTWNVGERESGKSDRGAPYEGSPPSRHPSHLPPALERCPDAALEPEAVDRRGGVERADAAEADARPLEAAFLQQTARGGVRDAGAGVERRVIKVREAVVDQRAHRFGGVALAPMRH